jgi:hypothetical protein
MSTAKRSEQGTKTSDDSNNSVPDGPNGNVSKSNGSTVETTSGLKSVSFVRPNSTSPALLSEREARGRQYRSVESIGGASGNQVGRDLTERGTALDSESRLAREPEESPNMRVLADDRNRVGREGSQPLPIFVSDCAERLRARASADVPSPPR